MKTVEISINNLILSFVLKCWVDPNNEIIFLFVLISSFVRINFLFD